MEKMSVWLEREGGRKWWDLIVLSRPTKFQPPFWRENRREERELMIITILPPLLRDGNFALPLLASPRADFPHPAKVVGRRWGKILAPHHRTG